MTLLAIVVVGLACYLGLGWWHTRRKLLDYRQWTINVSALRNTIDLTGRVRPQFMYIDNPQWDAPDSVRDWLHYRGLYDSYLPRVISWCDEQGIRVPLKPPDTAWSFLAWPVDLWIAHHFRQRRQLTERAEATRAKDVEAWKQRQAIEELLR